MFDGREYLLERALRADFSLIKGWRSDRLGNLQYRMTARNFNPMMAVAGRVTIAEVEEVVEARGMDPHHVHTPSIYIQRFICCSHQEKRVERRTVRKGEGA